MKPGLSRAVPAAILGFLGSLVFVMVLRGLQGVEPIFDAEIGMILAAFVSSAAFVWGAGGADPRMSEHPHEPEIDQETGLILISENEIEAIEGEAIEDEEEAAAAKPTTVLGYTMWQVAFWTTMLIVVLFGFATLPTGLFLRTTTDPLASRDAIGYYNFQMPFGGPEVQLSQLTVFVIFVIITLLTLAAVGGALALMFASLSRNLAETREGKPARMAYEPVRDVERKPFFGDLMKTAPIVLVYIVFFYSLSSIADNLTLLFIAIAIGLGVLLTLVRTRNMDMTDSIIEAIKVNAMTAALVLLFPILYLLHYEVLVGLIIAGPNWLRVLLSIGGTAALAPLLVFVLYNDTVSDMIVGSARSLARSLREAEGTSTAAEPQVESTQIQKAEVTES
ncbi:MAG: hypothetical protein ACOCX3_02600 [Chloroflexota bacterium]